MVQGEAPVAISPADELQVFVERRSSNRRKRHHTLCLRGSVSYWDVRMLTSGSFPSHQTRTRRDCFSPLAPLVGSRLPLLRRSYSLLVGRRCVRRSAQCRRDNNIGSTPRPRSAPSQRLWLRAVRQPRVDTTRSAPRDAVLTFGPTMAPGAQVPASLRTRAEVSGAVLGLVSMRRIHVESNVYSSGREAKAD